MAESSGEEGLVSVVVGEMVPSEVGVEVADDLSVEEGVVGSEVGMMRSDEDAGTATMKCGDG